MDCCLHAYHIPSSHQSIGKFFLFPPIYLTRQSPGVCVCLENSLFCGLGPLDQNSVHILCQSKYTSQLYSDETLILKHSPAGDSLHKISLETWWPHGSGLATGSGGRVCLTSFLEANVAPTLPKLGSGEILYVPNTFYNVPLCLVTHECAHVHGTACVSLQRVHSALLYVWNPIS